MTARQIILDCDPGHDDAVAILFAAGHPGVDLVGITTVAGNQTLDRTTHNACVVCSVGGIEVPVHAGAARPLLRPLRTAAEIHGESGLDGPAPIEPAVAPRAGHAVDWIIDTVLAAPGDVSLVAVGPLTNLAMALRREPAVAEAVREVVIMGGSYTRGNTTPAAEFNILVDPEAASIVFEAPWPVTMVGLDVTHQALCTPEVQRGFAEMGTPAGDFIDGLMRFFRGNYAGVTGMADPPVHDPCAVAVLADPDTVEVVPATVQVETSGAFTSGMTVVDFKAPAGSRHRVATGLDAPRFWAAVHAAVAALPAPLS
ncbi:nucleoside hydrolase [Acidiferrimicrobium sp. IK]|uniref:nucleoside hydrolase n=1 Tax=Acidiferrimicrobium sp. IK TaxID=2871700 RepID=UPI0021CB4F8D|nr:nucleoside hydrolase [Acidiferrimicrobium sp. IK]MCU4183310.1 nucleoside hydrolase [Acidiferrimicrobium sp. IK]